MLPHLLHLDHDVGGGVARDRQGRLVEHDAAVGHRGALARLPRGEEDGGHALGVAHEYRVHRGGYVLHHVVHRKARVHQPTAARDVHGYGLPRLVHLEEEKLCDKGLGAAAGYEVGAT